MRSPITLSAKKHHISQKNISKNALNTLYKLHQAGYRALLVGGGVRDLLLNLKPKDFDIATNATPEQIAKVFTNCRLIGRRFRLAHVHYGREIIEVATFRGHHQQYKKGMIKRDNVYGDIEEDAARRDFSMNALYYDIATLDILDYATGLKDIKDKKIVLLGDAQRRYDEDPVRMLRALRFAAKLDFQIEQQTSQLIYQNSHLLQNIPPARLFDEVLKLFLGGAALKTFDLLRQYQLFSYLFPQTEQQLQEDETNLAFIQQGMINTDNRIQQGKPVTPTYLYALFLWGNVQQHWQRQIKKGLPTYPALQQAIASSLTQQQKNVMIPRRFCAQMRELWILQYRFENTNNKKALALLHHPRFRAAYDFLLLRTQVHEIKPKISEFWTALQIKQGLDPQNKKLNYNRRKH